MGRFRTLYRRQIFYPGWLGLLVNPFYFARAGLVRVIAELAPRLTGRLLDVGCGTKPYRELFTVELYHGLDIDSEVTRARGVAEFFYDGTIFPIDSGQYDAILCNQVLEHVFNPDEFLAEIRRVLKPGGKMLLTVPFVWDEHEQPYDYARYSSFGLRALLEKNGFRIVEQRKLGTNISTIFQLMNAYLFKTTSNLPRPGRMLVMLLLMAPVNLFGLLFGFLLPDNPDLYLDQVVLAEKAE